MSELVKSLQNHYLKNMTVYCRNKNNFINFIELEKIIFFEYLDIEDIKNLLSSLYYLTTDINNIILLYIYNIINNIDNFKSMYTQLYYLYENTNVLVDIIDKYINKDLIFTILLEKRTTLILNYINKIKFIDYDDIINIDLVEYLYNNIYKFIHDIRHMDEEYNISWDILDNFIPFQYYHNLDNNCINTNKNYSYIYNKIGNAFPFTQIIIRIQKHNSLRLHDVLDKLKISYKMLLSSKNANDVKKYYEELTDNFSKLPILKSRGIFIGFNECKYIRPKLEYFKNKLFVIYNKQNKRVKDQENEKLYIQSQIDEYKKIITDFEYIYKNLNINNEDNLQINHSLEYILMEYKNNEFDFDIYIESISLDSITETINNELKKSFVLTDTIRETIKNTYINNYYEIEINNQIIYVNDYVIYNYLKLELIKVFLYDIQR